MLLSRAKVLTDDAGFARLLRRCDQWARTDVFSATAARMSVLAIRPKPHGLVICSNIVNFTAFSTAHLNFLPLHR
jgi:hypothetical protein